VLLDWDGGGGFISATELPNGELLAAGTNGNRWALARLGPGGEELERAAGFDLGPGDGVHRALVDAQGRWLLFGAVVGDGGNDFALVRLAVPQNRIVLPRELQVGCSAASGAPLTALLVLGCALLLSRRRHRHSSHVTSALSVPTRAPPAANPVQNFELRGGGGRSARAGSGRASTGSAASSMMTTKCSAS
jgi:hypothetical protein